MPESSATKHAFDAAHAETYDQHFEPLRAVKDLIHLIIRVQLSHLPRDARISSAVPGDRREKYRAMFGKSFAVHGPAEVEAMMARAGFAAIAACYQAVLIRGWVATRK